MYLAIALSELRQRSLRTKADPLPFAITLYFTMSDSNSGEWATESLPDLSPKSASHAAAALVRR